MVRYLRTTKPARQKSAADLKHAPGGRCTCCSLGAAVAQQMGAAPPPLLYASRQPGKMKSNSDHSSLSLFCMGLPLMMTRCTVCSCLAASVICNTRKTSTRHSHLLLCSVLGNANETGMTADGTQCVPPSPHFPASVSAKHACRDVALDVTGCQGKARASAAAPGRHAVPSIRLDKACNRTTACRHAHLSIRVPDFVALVQHSHPPAHRQQQVPLQAQLLIGGEDQRAVVVRQRSIQQACTGGPRSGLRRIDGCCRCAAGTSHSYCLPGNSTQCDRLCDLQINAPATEHGGLHPVWHATART